MSEFEKMINGKLYADGDIEAQKIAHECHKLCHDYNMLYDTDDKRAEILKKLLPNASSDCYLQGNIYFDYGINTYIGKNFYANNSFTCLDVCKVTIGDNVFIGPNCSILTPMHPLRYQDRNKFYSEEFNRVLDKEYGKPITIKGNNWIAGNVTICAGVTIGYGSVIGAGSVVTKDIPDNVLAFGNPCRVVRNITEDDDIKLKKELF